MGRILPILFNTDMVKAILDGRKTATRRAIKPANPFKNREGYHQGSGLWVDGYSQDEEAKGYIKDYSVSSCWMTKKYYMEKYAPYRIGDILYIRETWQYLNRLDGNEQIMENTGKYYYAATDILPTGGYVDSRGITHETIPWRPSIHMPKEAARIWLKVTGVGIERLQDIDDNGILKEGLEIGCYFEDIWDSTVKKSDRKKYGWEANPWVWVIEFERCERPEEG